MLRNILRKSTCAFPIIFGIAASFLFEACSNADSFDVAPVAVAEAEEIGHNDETDSSSSLSKSSSSNKSSSSKAGISSSSKKGSSSSKAGSSSSNEKGSSSSTPDTSSSNEKGSSSSKAGSSSSNGKKAESSSSICENASATEIYQQQDIFSNKPFICKNGEATIATRADSLRLDSVGICLSKQDGFVGKGRFYENLMQRSYTCDGTTVRLATFSEENMHSGCTNEKIGTTQNGKICSNQGEWRDTTKSEKLLGMLCYAKTEPEQQLGGMLTCDRKGRWSVKDLTLDSVAAKGASNYLTGTHSWGTQVWTIGQKDMVLDFESAKKYCEDLTWNLNDTKSAGFHLATEDDLNRLVNYLTTTTPVPPRAGEIYESWEFEDPEEWERIVQRHETEHNNATNLYTKYITASNFFIEGENFGNANCTYEPIDENSDSTEFDCAVKQGILLWIDKEQQPITYAIYNYPTYNDGDFFHRPPKQVSVQLKSTAKLPFFCVNNNYTGKD